MPWNFPGSSGGRKEVFLIISQGKTIRLSMQSRHKEYHITINIDFCMFFIIAGCLALRRTSSHKIHGSNSNLRSRGRGGGGSAGASSGVVGGVDNDEGPRGEVFLKNSNLIILAIWLWIFNSLSYQYMTAFNPNVPLAAVGLLKICLSFFLWRRPLQWSAPQKFEFIDNAWKKKDWKNSVQDREASLW